MLRMSGGSGLLTCDEQVKSYLAGNPAIRLALNEDLAIGRQEGTGPRWGTGGGDVVMLDDCNFHESVSLDRFETERMLELVPPDGEFALMQYRRASVNASVSISTHYHRRSGLDKTSRPRLWPSELNGIVAQSCANQRI